MDENILTANFPKLRYTDKMHDRFSNPGEVYMANTQPSKIVFLLLRPNHLHQAWLSVRINIHVCIYKSLILA